MYNNTQFKNTVLATDDISIKSCKINCSYNDKIRDKNRRLLSLIYTCAKIAPAIKHAYVKGRPAEYLPTRILQPECSAFFVSFTTLCVLPSSKFERNKNAKFMNVA